MVTVRAENSDDIAAVRRVNELAFGGRTEAALVDALRNAANPYISLVAIESGQVVGHIFFSPVSIESQETVSTAMGLAPMAVLPKHQNRGVGSWLVQEGPENVSASAATWWWCWVILTITLVLDSFPLIRGVCVARTRFLLRLLWSRS